MYCPKCRAGYREGFNTCADCNVSLVTALPPLPSKKEVHFALSGDRLSYSAGPHHTHLNIPINEIVSIKAVYRSSFRHPIIGAILGIAGLVGSLYFVFQAVALGAFLYLFILPKGPFIPFVLFVSTYILWDLHNSPDIPWVVVKTQRKKHVMPIYGGSMEEVQSLINQIAGK